MNEYIFVSDLNENIRITITASSLAWALDILHVTVMHSEDFNLID